MTQTIHWFPESAEKILVGMGARTSPALEKFVEQIDGLEALDIFVAQIAYGFDPEAVSPQTFCQRTPYGNPESIRAHLDAAVERGWLESTAADQYTLSVKGKDVGKHFVEFVDQTIGSIEALPDAKLGRIVELLGKVVNKARELPKSTKAWGLAMRVRFEREDVAPLVMQARSRVLDMWAYRDDMHIAAWQPYEVDGHVWETLTFVWRNEANTAAALVKRVGGYRGYDKDAYAAALQELASRGWVAAENGKYVITEQGKQARQQAEDATDRCFDVPWTALDEAETKELQGLLAEFAEAVKPLEQE